MLPFLEFMKSLKRKTKQIVIVLTLTISAIGFSGCSMFPQAKKYLSKNINVAGAFTHSPDSFAPIETVGTSAVTKPLFCGDFSPLPTIEVKPLLRRRFLITTIIIEGID